VEKSLSTQEHKERKLWSHQQSIAHTYGSESDMLKMSKTVIPLQLLLEIKTVQSTQELCFANDGSNDDEGGRSAGRICTCGSAKSYSSAKLSDEPTEFIMYHLLHPCGTIYCTTCYFTYYTILLFTV